MKNCIFCDIVSKKTKAYILFENDNTLALLDIFPSVSGHTMVIPKKHGVTVQDFSKGELGEVMETVSMMTKNLTKAYNTSIFTIGINQGEEAGVHHLHVHVIPRYRTDGGGIVQSIVKSKVNENFEEVAERIKRTM